MDNEETVSTLIKSQKLSNFDTDYDCISICTECSESCLCSCHDDAPIRNKQGKTKEADDDGCCPDDTNSLIDKILKKLINIVVSSSSLSISTIKSDVSSCDECDSDCECPCHKKDGVDVLRDIYLSRGFRDEYDAQREQTRKHINLIGLIFKIDKTITDKQLLKLLIKGIRVLHIQLAFGTEDELNLLMLKVTNAIDTFQFNQSPYVTPIGISIETRGRQLRTGRLRNDKVIKLKTNDTVVLTANRQFKNCSVREIVYVANLQLYKHFLQVGDIIFINEHKIQLMIIKIIEQNLTCLILHGNKLRSYMDVITPYTLPTPINDEDLTLDEVEDCKFAVDNKVDFVVLPGVDDMKNVKPMHTLLTNIPNRPMLLANIDTCLVRSRKEFNRIIDEFEGIWINKLVRETKGTIGISDREHYIIDHARKQMKAIVIKKLNFYKKYVDTEGIPSEQMKNFLFSVPDCLLIQNFDLVDKINFKNLNNLCRPKFMPEEPLTVLSKIDALNKGEENPQLSKQFAKINSSQFVITKCAVNTSFLLHGKLIVCLTNNGKNAIFLSHHRPPCCPIIAVTNSKTLTKKLLIWKNVKPIYFNLENKPSMQLTDYQKFVEEQLEFGILYAEFNKWILIGDLMTYGFNTNPYNVDIDKLNSYRLHYNPEKLIKY